MRIIFHAVLGFLIINFTGSTLYPYDINVKMHMTPRLHYYQTNANIPANYQSGLRSPPPQNWVYNRPPGYPPPQMYTPINGPVNHYSLNNRVFSPQPEAQSIFPPQPEFQGVFSPQPEGIYYNNNDQYTPSQQQEPFSYSIPILGNQYATPTVEDLTIYSKVQPIPRNNRHRPLLQSSSRKGKYYSRHPNSTSRVPIDSSKTPWMSSNSEISKMNPNSNYRPGPEHTRFRRSLVKSGVSNSHPCHSTNFTHTHNSSPKLNKFPKISFTEWTIQSRKQPHRGIIQYLESNRPPNGNNKTLIFISPNSKPKENHFDLKMTTNFFRLKRSAASHKKIIVHKIQRKSPSHKTSHTTTGSNDNFNHPHSIHHLWNSLNSNDDEKLNEFKQTQALFLLQQLQDLLPDQKINFQKVSDLLKNQEHDHPHEEKNDVATSDEHEDDKDHINGNVELVMNLMKLQDAPPSPATDHKKHPSSGTTKETKPAAQPKIVSSKNKLLIPKSQKVPFCISVGEKCNFIQTKNGKPGSTNDCLEIMKQKGITNLKAIQKYCSSIYEEINKFARAQKSAQELANNRKVAHLMEIERKWVGSLPRLNTQQIQTTASGSEQMSPSSPSQMLPYYMAQQKQAQINNPPPPQELLGFRGTGSGGSSSAGGMNNNYQTNDYPAMAMPVSSTGDLGINMQPMTFPVSGQDGQQQQNQGYPNMIASADTLKDSS